MKKVKIAVRMADGSKQLYRAYPDDHEKLRSQMKYENAGAKTILIEVDCQKSLVDQVAA